MGGIKRFRPLGQLPITTTRRTTRSSPATPVAAVLAVERDYTGSGDEVGRGDRSAMAVSAGGFIALDCADPVALGECWADVLGEDAIAVCPDIVVPDAMGLAHRAARRGSRTPDLARQRRPEHRSTEWASLVVVEAGVW